MRANKTYPRQRGKKPKGKSKKLREQMKYNSIQNDESKRVKFFTLTETKDDIMNLHLVREIIKMRSI